LKGKQYYNATGLIPNTSYEIGTQTVDTSGNTNNTWVNHTAITARDSSVPSSITALKNISYAPNYINWTWTDSTSSDFAYVLIYINGIFNTSVKKGVRYYNATGLIANTKYTISTHSMDTSGNIQMAWVNNTNWTARENVLPIIKINAPQNTTYNTTNIPLNVSANEEISIWNYSLNNGGNVTFIPNTTITSSQGVRQNGNSLTVYARDTSGNLNSSTVYFKVDTLPPPTITNLNNITFEYNHINWTWIDNDEISYVMVYLDGIWKENVLKGIQSYDALNLNEGTQYNISTLSVDIAGNINQTWVNHTAMTSQAPIPIITCDQSCGFIIYYNVQSDTNFIIS
jgi:hypothetical protein